MKNIIEIEKELAEYNGDDRVISFVEKNKEFYEQPKGFKLHCGLFETDRLIDALVKLKANYYLSGPSAKNYIDSEKFLNEGIDIEYVNYSNYPEYPQLWGEFTHQVTIMDLIFNTGKIKY